MKKKTYIKCELDIIDIQTESSMLVSSIGFHDITTDADQLSPMFEDPVQSLLDDVMIYEK